MEGRMKLNIKSSKYEPLNSYLNSIKMKSILMTFTEIEIVLGFNLPASASKYPAWWDGASQHTQAYAWTTAGFKAKPNLQEKKVEFVRYSSLISISE